MKSNNYSATEMRLRIVLITGFFLAAALANLHAQDKKLIDSLNNAIALCKNDSVKVELLNRLGKNYNLAGDYKDALATALLTRDLYQKLGNKSKEAEQLDNIGSTYFYLMNNKLAIQYMEMAKSIREETGDEKGLAGSYNNLGTMYKEAKNYEMALTYELKGLQICEKYGLKKQIGMMDNNIGLVYMEQEQYEKSVSYFEKSLAIKQEMNDSFGLSVAYDNLGATLAGLGKYKESIEDLKKSIAIAEARHLPEKMMNAHQNLSTAYADIGDYENAYNEHVIYASLRDSMINMRSNEQVNELQAKYDADKREHDILVLQKKTEASDSLAEKRKLYLLIALTGGLFFLSVLVLFFVRIKNKKEKQVMELAKNKAEFEQKALRAQMNPHFIFNALNSIQHYILSNETQYAYDYLAKFSKLIRQVLVNSEYNTITLKKELELLELYIELEQRRFKNRFEYEIKYERNLPLEEIVIPVMLIQPFIENAIWHGIMNLAETQKGKLLLSIQLEKNVLKICVEDNGVGREKSALLKTNSEHESVGMLFSQKRLEILKSLNEMEMRVDVSDVHDANGLIAGTKVELFLTLEK
jgi:tetratricopeptide (TPR) repeat protein